MSAEGVTTTELAIGPNDKIYTGNYAGHIVAVDAESGRLLFDVPGGAGVARPVVAFGVSDVLVVNVNSDAKEPGARLHDFTSGRLVARFQANAQVSLFSDRSGFLGSQVKDGQIAVVAFDECARQEWQADLVGRESPFLVQSDGSIITRAWLSDSQSLLRRLSPDGRELARTDLTVLPTAWPLAVGADDTLYALDCYAGREKQGGSAALIALSTTLAPKWRVNLMLPKTLNFDLCPVERAQLDERGVLYLASQGDAGETNIVAVQTMSPGLADSDWPVPEGDARSHRWIALPNSPTSR